MPVERLKEIEGLTRAPDNFYIHSRIQRQLDAKRKMFETGEGFDWATAEALAFGSLLLEGNAVRLSGQDSERGTFSQRHSVLTDQESEEKYTPLNNLRFGQAPYEVINSPLSEAGVLGFEYGYSLAEPQMLVLWEAQFGDFANGAQVIIDQFIAAGGSKVAAHERAGDAAATRLRRPGSGALVGAPGALLATLRRRQHSGSELHDTI